MEGQLYLDWEKIHLYNSLMAVVTGASFLSLWSLVKKLIANTQLKPVGLSLNFAVLGIILFITGVHTTLTWPLAPTYPFDNSIFGEPCFVFGSLLLALAFYFWKGRETIGSMSMDDSEQLSFSIIQDFVSLRYIIMGMGLAVIMMGIAGIQYRIFIAPPEEPLVGPFLEIIPNFSSFVTGGLWILVGVAALGFVYYMNSVVSNKPRNFKWLVNLFFFLGFSYMGLGVVTYYSHVGMEINTMPPDTIKPNVINNPDPKFKTGDYSINPPQE